MSQTRQGTVHRCWAAPLGGCAGKLSGEHLVSAALWTGPTVTVVGLPWCKHEPKVVGADSITAHILCRQHNSDLSDVDSAGGNSLHVLRRAVALDAKRRQQRPRKWKVPRFEIDGKRLERWLLKTLINMAVSQDVRGVKWSCTGSPLDEPPEVLVRAAYGREPLAPPMGLYIVAAVGEMLQHEDGLEIATLLKPGEDALFGALFTLMGVRFLLHLDQVGVPPSMPLPSGHGWLTSDTRYHLPKMSFEVAGKLSHYIHVLWDLE